MRRRMSWLQRLERLERLVMMAVKPAAMMLTNADDGTHGDLVDEGVDF
jgi:hypothetical protein